mmetsp:Transcript_15896/g.49787  ORF Transcript_15896/g.49787 Transcript_15896/m.49787 type:complete len:160 (-) Transcript_15896:1140-1619(-)
MSSRAGSLFVGTVSRGVGVAARDSRVAAARAMSSYASDSITYSGGQASEGQGGFYGSGGARVKTKGVEWNSKAVAQLEDIQSLQTLMAEVAQLEAAIAEANDPLSETAIENKQTIKRLMTRPETTTLIESLEMGGQPVWGLSQSERSLVKEAREKMLNC